MEDEHKALCIVKAISSFIMEHEGSMTKPTTVHMTKDQRDLVISNFPYLISGDIYKDEDLSMKIILNDPGETAVGVGYVYFTDYVEGYKESC